MKFTVNIDNDLLSALNIMAADAGNSAQAELDKCIKFGIENRFYRKGYNRRKNAETKDLKSKVAQMEAKLAELMAREEELAIEE